MENIEIVKEIYQYLYERCSGHMFDNFKYKEKENLLINKFVKKLNYSIGEDWLWNYFCFQFNRYIDKKSRFGNKIPLNWIIGDKAFKTYKEASDQEKFLISEFVNRFGLKNPVFKREPFKVNRFLIEYEKTRFNTSERRLIHCKENYLFDNKGACIRCMNKIYCEID